MCAQGFVRYVAQRRQWEPALTYFPHTATFSSYSSEMLANIDEGPPVGEGDQELLEALRLAAMAIGKFAKVHPALAAPLIGSENLIISAHDRLREIGSGDAGVVRQACDSIQPTSRG
jgi:hypothetical protein